jgi:hypothetical protein
MDCLGTATNLTTMEELMRKYFGCLRDIAERMSGTYNSALQSLYSPLTTV